VFRFEVFTAVITKNPVFGILDPLAVAGSDVSEEHIASIIRVTRIGEL
jgi:hypothetical protein